VTPPIIVKIQKQICLTKTIYLINYNMPNNFVNSGKALKKNIHHIPSTSFQQLYKHIYFGLVIQTYLWNNRRSKNSSL